MKAQVFHRVGDALQYEERSTPTISITQVLIKVSVCGLCLTDKHIIEGEIPSKKSPLIPGHQIVGRIVQLGTKVKSYQLGDLVGVTWLAKTCGICSYCIDGKENLCESAQFTGCDVDGGYAEYVAAEADYLVRLPEGHDEAHLAPLLCAGVIGYRSFKLTEIKPHQKLGLIGFGGSAHIVIQVAKHFGCDVYVFTRSVEHQKLAKELGAIWASTIEECPPELLDAAILFAPSGDLVGASLSFLKRGGKLVINAIHMTNIPELPYASIYYEKSIQSAAHVTREDAKEFIKLATAIPIFTTIEKRPLKDANQAIDDLKHSRVNGSIVFTL